MRNKINVLVIDNNKSLTNDLEKYFSSHEVINVVACASDGEEGLSFIINHIMDVDVIIMDLIIPKLDGLFILGELAKRNINKGVIIATSFKDDDIMNEANQYGIDYYMLKPINFSSLEKRILSIKINKGRDRIFKEDAIISDLLHELGIPSHIRGYKYIKEGIKIIIKNGNSISYITKDIYPLIAKKYDTTSTRVERAIRHAIEISWNRGDLNLMEEAFGNSLDVNRDKPTNSEYLQTIADRLKNRENLILI